MSAVPSVSVVMPVFNCEAYVREAIDSILGQSLTNLELIIVDDGSTDGSPNVLRTVRDRRARVLRQRNSGAYAARNTGLAAARAEYIASMDADDICHPDRLWLQHEYLRSHRQVGLVGSWYVRFDRHQETEYRAPTEDYDIKYALFNENVFAGGGVMMRTDVVRRAQGYRSFYADDYDLWLRIAELSEAAIIPIFLYRYRISQSQTTATVGLRMRDDGLRAVRLAIQRCISGWDSLGYHSPWTNQKRAFATTCQAFAAHALKLGNIDLCLRILACSLKRDPLWTLDAWARNASRLARRRQPSGIWISR